MNDTTKSHNENEKNPKNIFEKKPEPYASSRILLNDSGLVAFKKIVPTTAVSPTSTSTTSSTNTGTLAPLEQQQQQQQQQRSTPVILREKVVIIGDACCGKTCLVKSLKYIAANNNNEEDVVLKTNHDHHHFINNYEMTKCVELNIAEIPIPNTNTYVDLFLHDMGGQSIFQQKEFFPRLHWKNCSYFIVCFDTTCRKSFESVEKWIGLIQSSSTEVSSWESHDAANVSGCSGRGADTSNDGVPNILLVGTKKDLRGDKNNDKQQQQEEYGDTSYTIITQKEGKDCATRYGCVEYFDCSAKDDRKNSHEPFEYIANLCIKKYNLLLSGDNGY